MPLEISNLVAGDIMMKTSDGSLTNKVITLGQKLFRFENSDIVHAGLLGRGIDGFDEFYVVEAQSAGLSQNKLLTNNAVYEYIVFRANDVQVQQALANTAEFMSSQQRANRAMSYSYSGAIKSLFTRNQGTISRADALLKKVVEGRSLPMYCSQFVTFAILAVHEQMEQSSTRSPLNSGFFTNVNKSPAELYADLASSNNFSCIGHLQRTALAV